MEQMKTIQQSKICTVKLSGESLLLSMDAEHRGEACETLIRLNPSWNFRDDVQVITGSRQLQTEDSKEHEQIAGHLRSIIGRTVTAISVEAVTNDLVIELDGRYILRTFVSDPTERETWRIGMKGKKLEIIGNADQIHMIL